MNYQHYTVCLITLLILASTEVLVLSSTYHIIFTDHFNIGRKFSSSI